MEFLFELNTRREISFLQATMYYFVYHVNTMAIKCQEKSIQLMNENKRIDIPRIKVVNYVGAKAKNEKNALKDYNRLKILIY